MNPGRKTFLRTPAWIDSEEGTAFTAVTPRIRDGLPLRVIARAAGRGRKRAERSPGHAAGPR